jgi:hypothetical protein
MLDLRPYQLSIAPMPAAARAVHEQGVHAREFPLVDQALRVLLHEHAAYPDSVSRAADGTALILCTTDLPGVTPAMVDWWFGWHLPESERYKLWHPKAHLKAVVKEDRSHLASDRARYVGNTSFVDEYIGEHLTKLAIEFHEPASFGVTGLDALGATAICARTADRVLSSEGGCLVHLIVPTPRGSEMRSAFWLGQITNRLPVVGSLISALVNRRYVRERVIPDRFLLDLFQHCSEEMNHLAKFLPALYREAHSASAGADGLSVGG